jgi:outer membrane receptor for ferrienterochelin and colicin
MLDEGFNKQDISLVLRGLSPTRGRQNVAVLQDDVDISSLAQGTAGGSFVINPRLLDMERIEVIKGPHAALFGRSAFNGAINYITKKPGDEFYGNAQIDVGTDNKYEGRAGFSGPWIEDKLAIGVNVAGWHFGGEYDSPVTGKGVGGGERHGDLRQSGLANHRRDHAVLDGDSFFAGPVASTSVDTFFWTPRFTLDSKTSDDA